MSDFTAKVGLVTGAGTALGERAPSRSERAGPP